MTQNERFSAPLIATDSGLRPGDFSVGSTQSRAAARSLLQSRLKAIRRREVIIGIDPEKPPHAGPYGDVSKQGEVGRLVGIPRGMTLADGLRAVGGFTEEELSHPSRQRAISGAEILTCVH